MSVSLPFRGAVAGAALVLGVLVAGCDRSAVPFGESTPSGPVPAVQQLVDDLRNDDLAGYARHAVPPELHARLAVAWGEGRTLWPLTELPLHARFQSFLDGLAAPRSEQTLLADYRRQFAGAHAELRSAATTLGLFATQYVRAEPSYGPDEREHYAQLIAALSRWGQRAPLGDASRARQALPRLALAARATGLAGADGLRGAGMERGLQRLGPFGALMKRVLLDYGLDINAALDGMRLTLVEQSGNQARVRLQYTLAGQPIDATVRLERRDGRWYLADLLHRAETAAAAPGTVSGLLSGP